MFSLRCELIRCCHFNCGLIILWTLQKKFCLFMCTGKIESNSFISVISGITSRNADDIAMYSASAVLRAFSV